MPPDFVVNGYVLQLAPVAVRLINAKHDKALKSLCKGKHLKIRFNRKTRERWLYIKDAPPEQLVSLGLMFQSYNIIKLMFVVYDLRFTLEGR